MNNIYKIIFLNRATYLGRTKIVKGKCIQYFQVKGKFYSIKVVTGFPSWPLEKTLKEVKRCPSKLSKQIP